MIKNIVFDLGGVVLGRDFEQRAHEIRLFPFMRGDQPYPQYWKDFDLGRITQRRMAEAVAEERGCSVDYADEQITSVGRMFDEFPQTAELIRELRSSGYRIFALSNMPREFWEWMSDMEIFDCFDGLLISSHENLAKPDPAFFRLLLDRYGLEASETLFIDDKPTNTAPASELGFEVCVYDTTTGPDEVRRILNARARHAKVSG